MFGCRIISRHFTSGCEQGQLGGALYEKVIFEWRRLCFRRALSLLQPEEFHFSLGLTFNLSMSDAYIIHISIDKPRLNENSILATSPLRHQYSRSSTKRIYQSVFRIIDFDDNEKLTFEIQETNSSKIGQLMNDQNVIDHLYQKMKTKEISTISLNMLKKGKKYL